MTSTSGAGGSATVDDPTDLDRGDYVAALKRTLKEIKSDDVPNLAAGVAFKMFLSLFPSLLAAVAIFGLVTTVAEMREWLGQAGTFLPGAAVELLEQPLIDLADSGSGAGLAAVLGVAAGLWSATSAAISLMKALSRAYDVPETRKFVRQRLVALALTVALLVSLIAIVVLLIMGPQVQEALLGWVPSPLDWLLGAVRFLIALVVLVVLFAFLYWIGPNREHPSWVWMSPGALFGVIGWLVVSGGFTLYAQSSDSYNETYGAIAGVVVMLVWLQLTMTVVLVGAEFNAEVERTRALHLRVGEGAGFAVPAATGPYTPADVESGESTIVEAETEAHTVDPLAAGDELAPAPTIPPPVRATADPQTSRTPSTAPARTAGAVAASVMAVAVFLGFARRRARR